MFEKKENMIRGQQVNVVELKITTEGQSMMLTLIGTVNMDTVNINFYNVVDLSLDSISFPFQIFGLEILDNKNRGWDSSMRYTVHDYEDGKIRFYCEKFEIL